MDAKPLLLETIRIKNGRVRNIKFHNQRCNSSRKLLYGSTNNIDLRNVIYPSQIASEEVKCRITYNEQVVNVEYEPYTIRQISSLAYIEIGDYDYSVKYADREILKDFFNQRGNKDDILMTKKGYITDTYYANVALLKDGKWYTPKFPLLNGTRRTQLLEKRKIIEVEIHIDQIKDYKAISIFNAMIPFQRMVLEL